MKTSRHDELENTASSFRCVPIRLRDGTLATLRPVVPSDAEAECAFVAGLSQAARFSRFHGAVNGLSDAMARYLTCVDQERHVALVATVVEGGREEIGRAHV